MKLVMDSEVIEKLKIPFDLAMVLASVYFKSPATNDTWENARRHGYIDYSSINCHGIPQGINLTEQGRELFENIFLDSELGGVPDRFEVLAQKLMEVFPKGKQPGGKYFFRGNVKDVSLKLKKFFKKYGSTYTDDQIIDAAKRYVASFNGNYTYMRLLKYFIWKMVPKVGNDGVTYMDEVSELADYISNETDNTANSEDWTVNLV